MRFEVLVRLVPRIEPGTPQNAAIVADSSSAPTAKSSIPAAPAILRRSRPHLHVPDLRCRPCSGGPPLPAPPSLRPCRRGASNALAHASGEVPRRPLSSSPAAVTTPKGTRARHRSRIEHLLGVHAWFATLSSTSSPGPHQSAAPARSPSVMVHPQPSQLPRQPPWTRASVNQGSSPLASASSRIGSRSGVVRYDKFSGCSSATFNRYEDRYDEERR
nr:uncharacterized protein LOC127345038 [Lolium perenne]